MTDDTQDQRLTDAERQSLREAGDHHPDLCDCEVTEFNDPPPDEDTACQGLLDTIAAVERILAARSVRDDPTLRERIDALTMWAVPTGYVGGSVDPLRQGAEDAVPVVRADELAAVLAEHAPTDDPTRQAEAWDVGFGTGVSYERTRAADGEFYPPTIPANPYRADRLAATPEDDS